MELVEDHRPDRRGHIPDGAGGKAAVVQAGAVGGVVVGVLDEHGRRDVDPPVDHLREEVAFHGTRGLGALIVPDPAVPHAVVPHIVEDLRVVPVGEDQYGPVALDRGHQVLVVPGDVQDPDGAQVDVGVVGKVFQPGQDAFVVEDAHGVLLSAAGAG